MQPRCIQSGRYDLVEAYERAPHQQLISSDNDASLKAFIMGWGPLRFFLPTTWEGTDPIAMYRQERDLLRAWVRFLVAIEERTNLLDSISDVLRLQDRAISFQVRQWLGLTVSLDCGYDDELHACLLLAKGNVIQKICGYLIGMFSPLDRRSFVIEQRGSRSSLRVVSGIDSLTKALYWMVWQDYFRKMPWQFCDECSRVFRPTSHHRRKFCPDRPCAHRRAARESARRGARSST
jgi:hypothetical protein